MIATKNKIFKLAGVAFTCAVIAACSADVSNPPPLNSGTASAGDADFSKFVSIGDSLTAGYADGALYLLGQQNSFPGILAQQFAEVGGGAFEQPLLKHDLPATDGNLGGLLVGGTPGLIENRFVLNTETESPERLEGDATDDVVGTGLNGMTFNNMGVPGAKSFHLLAPGYGEFAGLAVIPPTASPYFARFSTDPVSITLSVMDDAAAQAPSFYTLWIGNNDVLGFATSGGDDSDPITDPVAFEGYYTGIVDAMSASNAAVQGVLVNIADVSTIPFFTTVPYNAIPLDQATADLLNSNPDIIAYNAGLQAALAGSVITQEEADARTITFVAGQNAPVIEDETLFDFGAPLIRQATANDLILLPVSAYLGTEDENSAGTPPPAGLPWGLGTPLTDADVLIPAEIEAVNTARTAYNATIKAAADADANLVFLDAAAIMAQLSESGINYGNGSITADFATGGGFSLDGIHPTARGYAVIANSVVDVINSGFSANVYKVDPATYPAVFLK